MNDVGGETYRFDLYHDLADAWLGFDIDILYLELLAWPGEDECLCFVGCCFWGESWHVGGSKRDEVEAF